MSKTTIVNYIVDSIRNRVVSTEQNAINQGIDISNWDLWNENEGGRNWIDNEYESFRNMYFIYNSNSFLPKFTANNVREVYRFLNTLDDNILKHFLSFVIAGGSDSEIYKQYFELRDKITNVFNTNYNID